MTAINQFCGIYRFLSNFYPQQVTMYGWVYATAEHAFQAHKTENDGEHAAILHNTYPNNG